MYVKMWFAGEDLNPGLVYSRHSSHSKSYYITKITESLIQNRESDFTVGWPNKDPDIRINM